MLVRLGCSHSRTPCLRLKQHATSYCPMRFLSWARRGGLHLFDRSQECAFADPFLDVFGRIWPECILARDGSARIRKKGTAPMFFSQNQGQLRRSKHLPLAGVCLGNGWGVFMAALPPVVTHYMWPQPRNSPGEGWRRCRFSILSKCLAW